jgi:hypothetical protein
LGDHTYVLGDGTSRIKAEDVVRPIELALLHGSFALVNALMNSAFKGALIQLSGSLLFLDCRVSYDRSIALTLPLVNVLFDCSLADQSVNIAGPSALLLRNP